MNSRQNIFIFSLIIILLTPGWSVFASEKSPGNLYALSAVLMDGDSGRVLYQKSGNTPRPDTRTSASAAIFSSCTVSFLSRNRLTMPLSEK